MKFSAIYGVGNRPSCIVTFVMLPICVRHLIPFEYGVPGLVCTTISTIGLVAGSGMGGVMRRFYFDYSGEDEHGRVGEYVPLDGK